MTKKKDDKDKDVNDPSLFKACLKKVKTNGHLELFAKHMRDNN